MFNYVIGLLAGLVNLRLNFRLRGYVSRQYDGPLDGEMVLCYNFAAGSFHTE